ncbi:MAG TPA: hypothetical protein VFA65_09800 [Bryobacteraceae bacterium]|nr:hypothetical protein [Bryobacteraceae bacterium]
MQRAPTTNADALAGTCNSWIVEAFVAASFLPQSEDRMDKPQLRFWQTGYELVALGILFSR